MTNDTEPLSDRLLALRDVDKVFVGRDGSRVAALEQFSLEVCRGEIVSIIGPSGCGKSTVLRLIAGLELSTRGAVDWSHESEKGRIGFVFQRPVLMPWLTVRRNARFPLDIARIPKSDSNDIISELLKLVGLQDFDSALPSELSGGMQQRVAITRALATDPDVLLMDEPFGALDLLTRDALNDELLRIWEATGKTIILVTHSVEEAAYLSNRIAVMSPRPGRLLHIHNSQLTYPRNAATKLEPDFHGLMATLRSQLQIS